APASRRSPPRAWPAAEIVRPPRPEWNAPRRPDPTVAPPQRSPALRAWRLRCVAGLWRRQGRRGLQTALESRLRVPPFEAATPRADIRFLLPFHRAPFRPRHGRSKARCAPVQRGRAGLARSGPPARAAPQTRELPLRTFENALS